MSDLQVENSTTARRADLYRRIAAVWDEMPDTFQATELYDKINLTRHNHPGQRMVIASILTNDMKARQVIKPGGKRFWRKA